MRSMHDKCLWYKVSDIKNNIVCVLCNYQLHILTTRAFLTGFLPIFAMNVTIPRSARAVSFIGTVV